MKLSHLTAIGAIAAMSATAAHAGEMKAKSYTMDADAKIVAQTDGVAAETLDGPLITVVPNTRFEVLGVIERDGQTLYQVPASGTTFVNHVPAELTDVTTDVDVVDEYSYEYRGMTFTNRVVNGELADPALPVPANS